MVSYNYFNSLFEYNLHGVIMRNLFLITILAIVVFFAASSMAADKVVVIPINKCGDGLTKCSSQCVDTLNNPSFCGDCSTDCGTGNYCIQGICKKPSASACTTSSDCLYGICTNNICYEVKRVFVTSANYTGDLGGLVGADSKCQALADSAGLDGNYKAWLSTNT